MTGWDENSSASKEIKIDGEVTTADNKEQLIQEIVNAAQEKGYTRFNVYQNGTKIADPADIVFDDIEVGTDFTVTPYDKNSY